ncbi:hypothetical protein U1Q18_002658 [Sarracenia purpurea var. burkii]
MRQFGDLHRKSTPELLRRHRLRIDCGLHMKGVTTELLVAAIVDSLSVRLDGRISQHLPIKLGPLPVDGPISSFDNLGVMVKGVL